MKPTKLLLPSLLLVLIGTLMPGNGQVAGQYLDKIVHFLMFAFLAVNVAQSFKSNLVVWIVACLFLGLGTEVAQIYIPGRNFEWWDILADSLGVMLGFLFVYRSS